MSPLYIDLVDELLHQLLISLLDANSLTGVDGGPPAGEWRRRRFREFRGRKIDGDPSTDGTGPARAGCTL